MAELAPAPVTGREPPGRFGLALLAAAVLELAAIALIARMPRPAPPAPPAAARMVVHAATLAPPTPPAPPPPAPKPPPLKPPPSLPTPVFPAPPPAPIPLPIIRPLPPGPRGAPHIRPHQQVPPPPTTAALTPAPPTPPAPVNAAIQATETQLYAARLRAEVQQNLTVPDMVRMMAIDGTSRVSITVAPDGHLVAASLAASSGTASIDRAALASVRASSFPPFTPKMPPHPLTFVLDVHLSP